MLYRHCSLPTSLQKPTFMPCKSSLSIPQLKPLLSLHQWNPARHVASKMYHTRCLAFSTSATQSSPSNASDTAKPRFNTGQIHVIFGPMFAGKSSELLKRVAEFEAAGLKVALVKSDRDNRYSATHISTHDGLQRCCHAVAALAEVRAALGSAYKATDVIAIDEAQFFPDLLQFCAQAADLERKQVVVAGLDGDFKRKSFGQVLDLVPLSDTVTKLSARCAYCSNPALFSLRIAADQRQEVVGGADKYAPVCRQHYMELTDLRAS